MEATFIEKIITVQSKLKCNKSQYNSFGDYHYRSCEDILEAVKPLLKETGLILTLEDEIVVIGDRYYIKATATLTDGKNRQSTVAYAREADSKPKMDVSQVTGSASTYARKYALNGLFCIDDTKDADTLNKGENTEKTAKSGQKSNDKTKPQPKNQTKEKTPPPVPCEICGKMLTADYANKAKQHYGIVICSTACGEKAGLKFEK